MLPTQKRIDCTTRTSRKDGRIINSACLLPGNLPPALRSGSHLERQPGRQGSPAGLESHPTRGRMPGVSERTRVSELDERERPLRLVGARACQRRRKATESGSHSLLRVEEGDTCAVSGYPWSHQPLCAFVGLCYDLCFSIRIADENESLVPCCTILYAIAG